MYKVDEAFLEKKTRELRLKRTINQVCPACSDLHKIKRSIAPTKGMCSICGSGNSYLAIGGK